MADLTDPARHVLKLKPHAMSKLSEKSLTRAIVNYVEKYLALNVSEAVL